LKILPRQEENLELSNISRELCPQKKNFSREKTAKASKKNLTLNSYKNREF
jgi:hypothetical protein